jgi:hypothetical protein
LEGYHSTKWATSAKKYANVQLSKYAKY